MSNHRRDIIGQKFNRLLVLSDGKPKTRPSGAIVPTVICRCDCGKIVVACKYDVVSGATKSCGCLTQGVNSTHGKSKTRLYTAWLGMKSRCYNPKHRSYCHYGGRGITVCDEWKDDFLSFANWAIQNGWNENSTAKFQSIDRINVDGSYSPQNCRFVTMKVQENNRRNNLIIEYNGKRYSVAELAREVGISKKTLYDRLRYYGYTVEEAISKIKHKNRNVTKHQ